MSFITRALSLPMGTHSNRSRDEDQHSLRRSDAGGLNGDSVIDFLIILMEAKEWVRSREYVIEYTKKYFCMIAFD